MPILKQDNHLSMPTEDRQEHRLDQLSQDLADQGWAILTGYFDPSLLQDLANELLHYSDASALASAGIGRGKDFTVAPAIRSDQTRWLTGETAAQKLFFEHMERIRTGLNRRLYLGLAEFESHFALYEPGTFYAKHKDSFRGAANRILSTVTYLNPRWNSRDGGHLILFDPDTGNETVSIAPKAGTLAVFLSEEIAHEVQVTQLRRYSIAGWFRVQSNRLT